MAKDFDFEHIDRLSRGLPSGRKIGSRAIGHRLRKYERARVGRALKLGFLELDNSDRSNALNIYCLLCESQSKPVILLEKSARTARVKVFPITAKSFHSLDQEVFDGHLEAIVSERLSKQEALSFKALPLSEAKALTKRLVKILAGRNPNS